METERPEGYGFSFKDYRETIEAYKTAGYAVTGFPDYLANPQAKHLILRHDCDNSISQALRIAEIDTAAGASATFFVRVHAIGYNLLSLPSLQAIRAIEHLVITLNSTSKAGSQMYSEIPWIRGLIANAACLKQPWDVHLEDLVLTNQLAWEMFVMRMNF